MTKQIALLFSLTLLAGHTMATDVGQHPAVFAPRTLPGIEASTFRIGHPAQGTPGQAGHANPEHPAIAMHHAGLVPHIDLSTYLVQPPATTRWVY